MDSQKALPGVETPRDWSRCLLRIAKWSEVYETSDSRRHKQLAWISIPVGFGSNGFQRLLEQFDAYKAAALYGCWIAICKLAAAAPIRGTLGSGTGEPFPVSRMERLSGLPAAMFYELIEWAVSVGWLEIVESEDSNAGCVQSIDDRSPTGCQTSYPTPPNPTNPTPPNPTEPSAGVGGELDSGNSQDGWLRVAADLRAAGVSLVDKAVSAAQRAGATPEHVLQVIAYWRAGNGKWGPGALLTRLKGETALLPIREGWPRESRSEPKGWTPNGPEESKALLAREQAHADDVKRGRAELDELESRLGPTIDAASTDAIAERANLTGPALTLLHSKGWRADLIRTRVLRAFQE